MAANLFIIEAPGKRKGLFNVLKNAGVRDIDIVPTVGHLCANPDGLKPLAINAEYRETAYRIRADREQIAATIAAKASDARRIYLATDDDQEGDVIARDALMFCVPEEYRDRAVRLRLKSLAVAEVQQALRDAKPFDPMLAAHGDARRVIDRLIGGLSSDDGGVGRVQGSLLLALDQQRPVVGMVTHTLAASDGKAPFVAVEPIYAGEPIPEVVEIDAACAVASVEPCTMSAGPMNHDQILLQTSLRTGASVNNVSEAMQNLYEKGRMSYPRAKDFKITAESVRRIAMAARANGAVFNPGLFTEVRSAGGEHAHEAPTPMVLDVPLNRNFELLPLEEQVLVVLTQNLINAGVAGRLERPEMGAVPAGAQGLDWHRETAVGTRLWAVEPAVAGVQKWTMQQSLLHFMSNNQLGRPSTIIAHIDKFLTRNLVTQDFDLTAKGKKWAANLEAIFGDENLSQKIEEYIENNRKLPSAMVHDMIEAFELHSINTLIIENTESEHVYESPEISTEYVP